jgi:putative flavoprotein involved in K+ transport
VKPVERQRETFNTVIIGAGQAGLSVGYYLKKHGVPFTILEANKRVGDSWRKRWDSLHLFTPARYDGIAGMPFPAPSFSFPSKDQMADYLESYARHFALPVQTGVKVEKLTRHDGVFTLSAGNRTFEAENVVVAMSSYQSPRIPSCTQELDPKIVQMHSLDYRNPSQLREGSVLIVGAANSGAEIALDTARTHKTWLSGRDVGHVPFKIDGLAARLFLVHVLFRFVFHRVLTTNTPMGRKVRREIHAHGDRLIRTKPADLEQAGIERVPRLVGVKEGKPLLEDGTVLDAANVIWCTGFRPGLSWIDLPAVSNDEPEHDRGIVTKEPGLFFVGLRFLYALSSTMIHGISRDAEYVARAIVSRTQTEARAHTP